MRNKSWDSSFEIGEPTIDKQREEIFNIYDDIVDMSEDDEKIPDSKIRDVLYQLEEYLKSHFKTEEEILKKHELPNMEGHIAEHEMFITKVEEFILSFQSDNPYLLDNMLDFLKKWLVSHIMHTDSVYKDHLNK